MQFDRDEYKNKILQSPLFSLDKENESIAYRREVYKMVEYLYCYTMSICPQGLDYEEYAVEITDVAGACIRNYSSEKGPFLKYYVSAWKQEYSHIVGRDIIKNNYGGVKFTDSEARDIRRYMVLAQSHGLEPHSEQCMKVVSEATGKPIEEVKRVALAASSTSISDEIMTEGDETVSLFDTLVGSGDILETISSIDAIDELFDSIDSVFITLQERQKPLISELITTEVGPIVAEDERLVILVRKKSFFNENVFKEYVENKKILSEQEIAKHFSRSIESVSTAWHNFKIKLRR